MDNHDHDPNGDVSLTSLVGLRTLRGIGRALVEVPWGGGNETVTQVVLDIDGLLYELTEGANDGYRSSLSSVRSVRMTPLSIAPIDPPLVVQVNHRTAGSYSGKCDAIYMINEATGLVVLDIGTDNVDDWYPSFVFTWDPIGWTPEWLVPKDTGVIVKDDDGNPWVILEDFSSHAEAKVLLARRRNAVRDPRTVCIRLNKKTMRFEVHERAKDPDER